MISLVLLMVSLLWSNLVLCGATGGLDEEQAPALTGDTSDRLFTDQWAVHIEGGDPVADLIAQRHGFVNLGKIFGDYYHFQHRKVAKRSLTAGTTQSNKLDSDPDVRWVQQQVVKRRVKRDLIEIDASRSKRSPRDRSDRPSKRAQTSNSSPKSRSLNLYLNDPKWTQMWYLNRGMGLDMKVQEAWAQGVTGKGTVVTILDDGLEKDHPDLRRNYDPRASYDVNNHDEDPMPRYDLIDSNRHGTRCAGEVAAEGNNSICAVGVAYNAGIGGVRMLDGDVTDAVEARSLSLNPHHIDIYSASWGPDDDGKTVDGPGELATRAFIEGVTKGRNGKGSIFVWASGNGGRDHDNCNCDGYTNSIWTLSISSATENGYVPWYSEACSSTLATTYSSGSSGEKQIVTTDLHHSCTASHTGTSASAPLAAGICALALESNKNLTWRDMQHIVVRTAKPANLKADDWQVNGVGRNVSHSFGYGLMDAAAMVRLARVWNTVAPQQFCEIRAPDSNKLIPAKSKLKIQLSVRECTGVNYIEHLQARISLAAVSRGDIQIHLSSPSGTRSTLLALRPHDSSRNGFHSWPFMSVHYWGESPFGVWTLEIHNEGRYLATLSEWNVVIYGTKESPDAPDASPPSAVLQQKQPEKQQHQQHQQQQMTPKKADDVPVANQPPPLIKPSNELKLSTSERVPEGSPSGSVPLLLDELRATGSSHGNSVDSQENRGVQQPLPDAATSAGCREGHWDSTTAVCLTCRSGFYLWGGRCLTSCPAAHYASKQSINDAVISEICSPCHYSCLSCSGASDSECIDCHADAQLRSVITNPASPGSKTSVEMYCHPASLVKQLASYERWALIIELFLGLNAAVVCAMLAYMMCQGSAGSLGSLCSLSWRWRSQSSSYHNFNPVSSRDKPDRVVDVDDSTSLLSDEQM